MTTLSEQAIQTALAQSKDGPRIDRWLGVTPATGWCLKAVRTCYDVDAFDFTPNNGSAPWAIEAFDYGAFKHATDNPYDVPRGVPLFWRKPGGGPGHVAIGVGNAECLSTDITRDGYFDKVRIADIGRAWGMQLVGWTEDLNTVRVWTPPAPLPPIETRVIDHAIDLEASAIAHLAKVIDARKPGPARAALREARQKAMEARQAAIEARRIVKGIS